MQTVVSSHVWQRRTNKIIAMAVIIIGLTMMISTIPQCIYIGLIFIMLSLGWLAWMRMKEKKCEPPAPNSHPHAATISPVLFLVASQNFTQRQCVPTPADPNDRPPSYDQILKLDGLPPDYFTVLSAKPPRYEDIDGIERSWTVAVPVEMETAQMTNLPGVHSYREGSSPITSTSTCGAVSGGGSPPLTLDIPTLYECVPSSGSATPEDGTCKSSYVFQTSQTKPETSVVKSSSGEDGLESPK